jgi:uncharacterized membrane protein YfcA
MKIDRMGVYVLMSHLVITLAVIGAYLYTLYKGTPDEALKTALTIIIGYWFGAMGNNALRSKKANKNEGDGET